MPTTIKALIAAAVHNHTGCRAAAAYPSKLPRPATSRTPPMRAVSSVANANASSVPTRSPHRPINAAWIAPPIPPAATSATANAVTLLRRGNRFVGLEEAEGIALGVLAAREPADVRDRHLLARVAAELAHFRQVGVDVVAPEVDGGAPLVIHLRVDGAAPAVVLEHPVVHSLHAGTLDRPASEAFPELLAAIDVLRRKLHVHDLLAHLASFSRDAIRSRAW